MVKIMIMIIMVILMMRMVMKVTKTLKYHEMIKILGESFPIGKPLKSVIKFGTQSQLLGSPYCRMGPNPIPFQRFIGAIIFAKKLEIWYIFSGSEF